MGKNCDAGAVIFQRVAAFTFLCLTETRLQSVEERQKIKV